MRSVPRHVWFYGLLIPLVYLIAEFSLNHHLIEVLDETVTDDILEGLEFWGRVISGLGLGLLLQRLLSFRRGNTVIGLFASLVVGVAVMWNVQKALIDYFVEIANAKDKQAAIALAWIAPKAADGSLQTLAGDKVLLSEVSGMERNIVLAMFPAAALHMKDREEQLARWLERSDLGSDFSGVSDQMANNAYKNLIVPPVAMGLSILFALVNLSAGVAFVLGVIQRRWRSAVMGIALGVCLAVSLIPQSALLDSPGYRHAFREGLWESKPVLALLVEWSYQASHAWGQVSTWVHHYLAFDFRFELPKTGSAV